MKKLTDICDIQYGYAFDSKCFTEDSSYPQLVRIRDVKKGYSETYYSGDYPEEYILSEGDLLVGMDGEFNIARWKCSGALLNQRVCKLIAKVGTNEEYLRFAMSKSLKEIEQRTAFVTVKHLSAKELNKLELDVPELSKQDKIADTLNRLERVIEARKEELEKLDNLIKARFVELFDGKYPEDTLLNLCNIIDYRGKTPEKVECGLPFITAKNVKMHHMTMEPREFISKETYDKVMVRGFPKEGDVVFTTEAPLGNVCRIPHFDTEFYIGQRIVTMQTDALNPIYLEYALSDEEFARKYMSKSSGSTVTGIRVRLLEQLTVPIPPRTFQDEFSIFVEQVDKSKVAVQKALTETQLLFDSLMQQYFG